MPAPPTPFPHPFSRCPHASPLPGLLSVSRWGCRQSPRRPQHQHGQGLGPRRVDLLVPVQVGAPAEALATEGAGVGPDATMGALVGGEV